MSCGHNQSRIAAALLAGAVSTATAGVVTAPGAVPRRYHRTLWTAGAAWEGGLAKASGLLGGLYQISLLPSTVTQDPQGGQDVTAPSLYVHAGAMGGLKVLPSSDITVFGLVQLGLLDRPACQNRWLTWLSAVGPTAVVSSLSAIGAGPSLRVEIMDNIGVQLGALYLPSQNRWYPMITIDYFRNLFQDLGFTGSWYWPQ